MMVMVVNGMPQRKPQRPPVWATQACVLKHLLLVVEVVTDQLHTLREWFFACVFDAVSYEIHAGFTVCLLNVGKT